MESLVSVIIPVYNCADYIEQTVNSAINQTYKNIEVVLIDDGSKDNIEDKVNNLKEKYGDKIVYIRQDNSGVAIARNRGISEAKGQYIAFLDSDDLWLENKIEKQLKRISDTGYEACYCGYTEWYDVSGKMKNVKWNFVEGDCLEEFLKWNVWAQTGTWIIKKNILVNRNIEFTPNCSWAEDAEFFLKVISMTKVCCVKEYLTLYRIRENQSLSSQASKKLDIRETEVWRRLSLWLKENRSQSITLDIEKSIDLINRFRIPDLIIKKLYSCWKLEANRQRCREIYKENLEIIKNLKIVYNMEGLKLLIIRNILKLYFR